MSKVIEMPLADGGSVLVETYDTSGVQSSSSAGTAMRGGQPARGPLTRGLGHRKPLIERGTQTLEQSVASISPALRAVLEELRRISTDLTQIELEVGLKLTGEAGMVLARAGTEANFQVHLTWKRSPGGDSAARRSGEGGKDSATD
ncbi:MAG TPA: CU044_2847 family protein [Solirubrobacteraceae bacterium]